ncbi:protein phosphatase 2C domain-containing protein [Terasakiella sp. SH-1]|uniref:protein phosphatase 2C domain-containing protein n=1 Tax=Terasakiella sp. SH-1 TaxID=2560057 RepID=UPI001073A625|nr:protein phosphatase 2C domain-containing protein [Terasakiella sp. SH-1]
MQETAAATVTKTVTEIDVRGQTMAKPKNDVINGATQAVVRQNEDRFRVEQNDGRVLMAVADGAGSSGMYCGAWAEKLCSRLPETPLSSYDDLNGWIDGFWEEFSTFAKKQCANNHGQHNKLVKEGSFATLVASWLDQQDDRLTLDCLNYGDSTLYVFEEMGNEVMLTAALPGNLASQEADPHLLNWKDLPKAEQVQVLSHEIKNDAMVVLASDGMGLFVILRYLSYLAQKQETAYSDVARNFMSEYRHLLQNGTSPVANFVRTHQAEPVSDFKGELLDLYHALGTAEGFQGYIAERYEEGLLPNDDSTLVMTMIKKREESIAQN